MAAVSALSVGLVLSAPYALADPVARAKAKAAAAAGAAAAAQQRVQGAQARVAAAEQQLAALQDTSEIAAEAYNAAADKLQWADRVAAAARARLAAATVRLLTLRAEAGDLAVRAYTSGSFSSIAALTETGGPGTWLDRLSSLSAVAHGQRAALAQLAVAEHEQAVARAAAEQAAADQRALTRERKRQRDAVLAAAARSQVVLGQLQAAQQEVVAQANAAVGEAQQARHAVDVAIAQRALAAARARAAALAEQRRAQALAARSFSKTAARSVSRTETVRVHRPRPVVLGSGGAAVAVAAAYRQIGKPYVWAAAGPDSFDCSGLTQYVWAKAGVRLSHYSGAQFREGSPVSRAALRPGDLVFFGSPIHHVGIYVGGGMMIDAPHTGAFVRKEPIWWNTYVGAVRPG